MKKYFILLTLIVGLLSSCSDYLDVKPKSQIDKDILFQTQDGFMEALNGVYSRAASGELYGNQLTTAFLDALAQNYSLIDTRNLEYKEAGNFNWYHQDVTNLRNSIWGELYKAIGNCNLILDHIDDKQFLFDDGYYDLIKAEALGLRGYFHLDLIRMYAPSFESSPSAFAIPYVTTFSNQITRQVTVRQALDSVIADLTAAKELLNEIDPIRYGEYRIGYPFDGEDNDELPDDGSNEESGALFLQNRRHRFNYYAVVGTLARAYLCKGDNENALKYAKEIIDSERFEWSEREALAEVEGEKRDRIAYPEIIFGWSVPARESDLRDRFERGATALHVRLDPGKAIYEVATVGGEDLRYKYWFKQSSEGSVNKLMLQKYRREVMNLHPLVAPAIRLSEIYYIASEASYETNQWAAWDFFNTIRRQRGIGVGYEVWSGSKEDLLSLLVKEARKEFYGEGQIFYMYKRLNREIPKLDGSIIEPSNAIYVIPMPDEETELGERN